jgi:platelet-activating factor acetylhydrolase IB subunit alpha
MVLTKKQKEDLHGAMLEYMQAEGFTSAAAEFEREASVAKVAKEGTLERKWTSVVRLQSKIGALEKKVAEMTEELANGGGGGGSIGGKKRYDQRC